VSGPTLYTYVWNNPTNDTDPTGFEDAKTAGIRDAAEGWSTVYCASCNSMSELLGSVMDTLGRGGTVAFTGKPGDSVFAGLTPGLSFQGGLFIANVVSGNASNTTDVGGKGAPYRQPAMTKAEYEASSTAGLGSAGASSSKPTKIKDWFRGTPVNSVYSNINNPDGTIDKFYAPAGTDWSAVYATGRANGMNPFKVDSAVGHWGAFDFQRYDTTFIGAYSNASNFAVGLYMNGAGYSLSQTLEIAGGFAHLFSSNAGDPNQAKWQTNGWNAASKQQFPVTYPYGWRLPYEQN